MNVDRSSSLVPRPNSNPNRANVPLHRTFPLFPINLGSCLMRQRGGEKEELDTTIHIISDIHITPFRDWDDSGGEGKGSQVLFACPVNMPLASCYETENETRLNEMEHQPERPTATDRPRGPLFPIVCFFQIVIPCIFSHISFLF
jgi:hypothetical protein